jgi:hypothetical protein
MRVDEVIEIVETLCRGSFNEHERLMLQRYFIRKNFEWMTLRYIAVLTKGSGHYTVLSSIKSVKNQLKFGLIRMQISEAIMLRKNKHYERINPISKTNATR